MSTDLALDGDDVRALIGAARELGHDAEAIATLLNVTGQPVPAGGISWTAYLVESVLDGWGGRA